MKQFVVIGAGHFGKALVTELQPMKCQVMLIDKSAEDIAELSAFVEKVYVADISSTETLNRLMPENPDAVIVDLGKNHEATFLVTHHLGTLGVRPLIVKAENEEQEEVLIALGATKVIVPNRSAAQRLVPSLILDNFFQLLPLSPELSLIEMQMPQAFWGKTLEEMSLRQKYSVNVLAMRDITSDKFTLFEPQYKVTKNDILLCLGPNRELQNMAHQEGAHLSSSSLAKGIRKALTSRSKT